MKDKFEQVEGLVVDKGDAVLQATRKANKLQEEAKELLEQSSMKLLRLRGNHIEYVEYLVYFHTV